MAPVMKCALLVSSATAFSVFTKPAVTPRVTSAREASARTSIIGGNWKMNPASLTEAVDLANALVSASSDLRGEAIVFPPAPFLTAVGDIIKDSPIHLGAQCIYYENGGAYTGAMSASMAKSVGATYILAGHSERRVVFGDNDDDINRQVLKTIENGMKPCLCIGETKDEYESNLVQSVCAIQLAKCLVGVSKEDMKDIVIAYEPVWAIGTGLVCPSDVAQNTHEFIRSKIADMYDMETAEAVRIQYGGSVSPESVDELMSMPDIDGCESFSLFFLT
uniref:Triosephosphate isomerase n=2 Tax=Aureoumbra lagunensis TaxID=44058 RepID=A0A7S3NDN0_9STRA